MSKLTTTMPVEVTGITAAEQTILHEILKDVQVSVERMARAASKWVELPEKTRARIVEQTNPSLREFWRRLERVGLGTLHPLLITMAGAAANLLGKMPLEDQDKYLQELIPVVHRKGRGWDERLVDVADMSEEQRKQAFKIGPDGTVTVRDRDAQITYLTDKAARKMIEEHAAEALKKVDRVGWKVEKGRVWIKPSSIEAGLTKRQVEQILKDLED